MNELPVEKQDVGRLDDPVYLMAVTPELVKEISEAFALKFTVTIDRGLIVEVIPKA
jgi:hypothetical protein